MLKGLATAFPSTRGPNPIQSPASRSLTMCWAVQPPQMSAETISVSVRRKAAPRFAHKVIRVVVTSKRSVLTRSIAPITRMASGHSTTPNS